MLKFFPDKTKVIFLDLEYFVPEQDRKRQSTSGMMFNPSLPGHKVLGGVFMTYYPMLDKCDKPFSVWEWECQCEQQVMVKLFQYLEKHWKGIEFKEQMGSLMLSGIGISHSDIPSLNAKMNEHQVGSPERIFDVLYGCRQIDLSVAAFCQFSSKKHKYFTYTKTKSDLYQKYLEGKRMESGTSVWDLYDAGKYAEIEARTQEEVADSFAIYKSMSDLKRSHSNKLERLAKIDRDRLNQLDEGATQEIITL